MYKDIKNYRYHCMCETIYNGEICAIRTKYFIQLIFGCIENNKFAKALSARNGAI